MPYLIRLKQAADLHSNRISQWLALEQLNEPGRAQRLLGLANIYRLKRDHFQNALRRRFSGLAEWDIPSGGLFFWLRLNKAIDTAELLSAAIGENVAFMPGEPFFAESTGAYPAIRLNFSHASAQAADRGLATLASLIADRNSRLD
jgi:2-aminoadipate transaminase